MNIIKQTRKELKLTQSQMALKMGLTQPAIQQKESGKRKITKQDLMIVNMIIKDSKK